jgi:hypothetical protein
MRKAQLKQFVEMIEQQFNSNKQIIIEQYVEHLNGASDKFKTPCIESYAVAGIQVHNDPKGDLNELPFRMLYNFINSYRSYMMERHPETFKQKPECILNFTPTTS